MGDIYLFGMIVSGTIFFAVWLFILLAHLLAAAKGFVYEQRTEWPSWSWAHTGAFMAAEDVGFGLAMGLLGILIGLMLWPIAWLGLIVAGCLLAARKAVRFHKVFEAHKHDQETGSVVR